MSNDFLKIVDKTPDDRRWARGKPGLGWKAGVAICTVRLPTFTKHIDVRGRRLAPATTALMSPPMHRRNALRQVSWLFREKTRVLRRSGVIDRSPMMAFEERHLGRHRCLSMPSTEKIHRNPLNCGTRMLYLWFNRGIVYSMLGNINHLTHIIKHILLSGHDLRARVCCV